MFLGRVFFICLYCYAIAAMSQPKDSNAILMDIYDGVIFPEDEEISEVCNAIIQESNDDYIRAVAHLHLGMVKDRRQDLISLRHYQEALRLERISDTTDHYLEMSALWGIGYVFEAHGSNKTARSYYEQALPIAAKFDEELPDSLTSKSMSLRFNIANTYAADLDQHAVKLYFDVRREAEKNGNVRKVVQTNNQIGELFMALNRYDHARLYFEKSISLNYSARPGYIADAYSKLGEICLNENQPLQAKRFFLKALEYTHDEQRFEPLKNLILTYNMLGDHQSADSVGLLALGYFDKVGFVESNIDIFYLLAQANTDDISTYTAYIEQYRTTLSTYTQQQKELIQIRDLNNVHRVLDTYYKELEMKDTSERYVLLFVLLCGAALLLLVGVVGWHFRYKKAEKEDTSEAFKQSDLTFNRIKDHLTKH